MSKEQIYRDLATDTVIGDPPTPGDTAETKSPFDDNSFARTRALEIAAGLMTEHGRTAAQIVADARVFYDFLSGKPEPDTQA